MDESDKDSFAHLNFFNDLFSPVSSFNVAREKISIVGEKSFWMWRGISPAVAETTDRCRRGLVKILQKQDWDKKIVESLLEDIAQLNRLHETTDKKAKTSVKSV